MKQILAIQGLDAGAKAPQPVEKEVVIRKPFAGWELKDWLQTLFGVLIFVVIVGLLVVRFGLPWRAYGGEVGWRIPAYEELRSANGIFMIDEAKTSHSPYRFRSSGGEDLVLECYPKGDAYRIFDSNTCLAGHGEAFGGGPVNIRYFDIKKKNGLNASILGEVSRNGNTILPFSESLSRYRTALAIQEKEKSGLPVAVVIFGFTLLAIIFVFLKK